MRPIPYCQECEKTLGSCSLRLQVAKILWHARRHHPEYYQRMLDEPPEDVHSGDDAVIVQRGIRR